MSSAAKVLHKVVHLARRGKKTCKWVGNGKGAWGPVCAARLCSKSSTASTNISGQAAASISATTITNEKAYSEPTCGSSISKKIKRMRGWLGQSAKQYSMHGRISPDNAAHCRPHGSKWIPALSKAPTLELLFAQACEKLRPVRAEHPCLGGLGEALASRPLAIHEGRLELLEIPGLVDSLASRRKVQLLVEFVFSLFLGCCRVLRLGRFFLLGRQLLLLFGPPGQC